MGVGWCVSILLVLIRVAVLGEVAGFAAGSLWGCFLVLFEMESGVCVGYQHIWDMKCWF